MSTGKVLEDILAAAVVALAVRPAVARAGEQEEDAYEAGARLSELLESFEEGVLIEDATRRVLLANARFRNVAGLSDSTGDLAGEDASSLVGELRCEGDGLDSFLLCPGDGRILERDHVAIVVGGESRGGLWCYRDVTERERATGSVRASEEQVRAAVEEVLDAGVLVADLDGVALDANPRVASLTGRTLHEILGRKVHELLPPGTARDGGGSLVRGMGYEARLRDETRVEVRVVPYRDGSGRVAGTISVVVDITGRRSVEEALREGEARFRTIFEQSAVGIAISDPERRLLETNPAYQEMLGYTGEELYGKEISSLSHPGDEAADLELNRELLAGGMDRYQKEKRLVRKDGKTVLVSLTGSIVRDASGAPRFLVGMAQDVGERRETEEELRRSEEKFYRFVEHAADAFFVHDLSGRIVDVNQRACESLGYMRGELLEMNVCDIENNITPGSLSRLWEEMVPGLPVTVDGEHRRRDGTTFPVEVRIGSFASEGRELMLALARDVTDRKLVEEKHRESEGRFRQLFEQSVDALFVHDDEGYIVDCNPEACRSLGYERQELLRLSVRDFVTDLLSEEEKKARGEDSSWKRALRGGPGETINMHQNRHVRKNGTTFPVEVGIGSIEYGGRRLVVASARDITERKELEGRLAYQAFHDGLTGLPNRALFLDRLGHALDAAGRSEDSVALLFLDLDNFKYVNDSLGHAAGDELLLAVGRRLTGCVRPGDTVARLGGDEFTVLLEGISEAGEVERVLERVMGSLALPFEVAGEEVSATASVGVVPDARRRGSGPDDVMRDADIAMYRAKEGGKARYAIYEEAMLLRATERLATERDLRASLADASTGGFEVHYQPQVSLASGEVTGLEALVRWRHPARGLVPANEFIPVAEETGLVSQIGRVVLSEACSAAVRWRAARPPDAPGLLLSVNVSAYQLKDPGFVEEVASILKASGLEPEKLVLEIAEGVLMDEPDRKAEKLAELKALGVRISIDDFGTGYSSLAHLKRFPADFLKIDRSFLDGLGQVLEDTVLVSGMLGLARSLGLSVVAEGIETAEQLDQLRDLGCDLGQGFYFSRAVPEAEATDIVVPEEPKPPA